jgi:primosomal protein N' (replication factor Y)
MPTRPDIPATEGVAPQRSPVFVEVAVPLPLPQRFTYRVAAAQAADVAVGSVVKVPFGRRQVWGVVEAIVGEPDLPRLRDVLQTLPAAYTVEEPARQLAHWIADYYACSPGEALTLMLPPRPGTAERVRDHRPQSATPQTPHPLTPAQKTAVDALDAAVAERRYQSFVLHGVTGSGKTEVYLQVIEKVLAAGRGALVLLPEIALTPQTLRRLQARFPGRVDPYHSRLSHGERCAVWERAARGETPLVVGARSAVFAPVKDLGLIVVDEEHEPSYKSDSRPRYHARDVALMRGSLASVPVVLGSATPSLESFHNVRSGKHRLLELPQRVGAGGLPQVQIFDRRLDGPGRMPALGQTLELALDEALARHEQAIVFHNRRGFARFLQCSVCGHVVHCPNCDISLTYHLKDDRLHCHYCGVRERVPPTCPSCEAPVLRPRGAGTQRVEVTLEARFPRARILRLDQDTTGRKAAHREILEAFGRGEADILVGTQMVAKGLHFPRVTVVGVIDADAGLHFPDFRAHERSFQLLTQVAGRSGRTGPGTVILQTCDPEHRVLQRVGGHDVLGFLEEELREREALGYPPVRRLAAITVTSPEEARLEQCLAELGRRLRTALAGSGIEMVGPARAVLARVNRRFRGQMLLKGGLSVAGKRTILALFEEIQGRPGGRKLDLALDVDPVQLL